MIRARGTVAVAAGGATLVAATLLVTVPEAVSGWSSMIVVNRARAAGAATTRAGLVGSGVFCMVVNVIRLAGTLSTSAARPSSRGMLARPLSTVSALVAALAREYSVAGSVRTPVPFSVRITEDRKMCWA